MWSWDSMILFKYTAGLNLLIFFRNFVSILKRKWIYSFLYSFSNRMTLYCEKSWWVFRLFCVSLKSLCKFEWFLSSLVFVTLWIGARQAPQSMGFSRKEHWSGFPCPPSGDFPDPGIEATSLMSPALAGILACKTLAGILVLYHWCHLGKP